MTNEKKLMKTYIVALSQENNLAEDRSKNWTTYPSQEFDTFNACGGGGDNRVVTELSFGHVTTKTWAYFGVFSFFRTKISAKKMSPPHPNHFFVNTKTEVIQIN